MVSPFVLGEVVKGAKKEYLPSDTRRHGLVGQRGRHSLWCEVKKREGMEREG